jgi:hypothetical protein
MRQITGECDEHHMPQGSRDWFVIKPSSSAKFGQVQQIQIELYSLANDVG